MRPFNIYVSNDNLVWLENLRDEVTGDFDSEATCSLTILTNSGTDLVGSAAMTFLPGSTTGEYFGTIDDAVTFVEGERYTSQVLAVGSAGQQGQWTTHFIAQRRE